MKKLLFFHLVLTSAFCLGQSCPNLVSPINGEQNVAVDTSISWTPVVGVPGYIISIGTSPGATDIENERAIGSVTTYTPPRGLPENSDIYVTISLFFFDRENIICGERTFRTRDVTTPPPCTTITTPSNLSANVNIRTLIIWDYTPTATAYSISIGTSLEGEEIVPVTNLGNVLSFSPPTDLPQNTEIFVKVIAFNDNGSTSQTCTTYSFTTGSLAATPECTKLSNPLNGSINVPLTPLLEWDSAPNATGYRVTIGASPFTAEILDNVTFFTNSTLVLNFEPNRTFFITIVPFNEAGEAIGCAQESFSTLLGCGPYFDAATGELVNLKPKIDFPDSISICLNEIPLVVKSNDSAEGFRWYKITGNSQELLSTGNQVEIIGEGLYRYEAYNTVSQEAQIMECISPKEFRVVASKAPEIVSLNVTRTGLGINIRVQVQNEGDFEYAINSPDGPYQNDNLFENLEDRSHTIFVRDKNGCGIVEETYGHLISAEDFPSFFTPNGDLINDYWQYIESSNSQELQLEIILIFNRSGRLVAQITPDSPGWDGKLNGQNLPASDYWFRATFSEGEEFRGHFSLKR